MLILKFLFGVPSSDWFHFLYFFLGIVLFIAIAEKTRTTVGWSPEVNRKLVHILTGVLIFFTPFFFVSSKPLILMAVIFIGVNYFGVKTEKLKGMHNTQRQTYGTVYYPISFLLLVLLCWKNYKTAIMLSMLVLALSDALAAIVGENLRNPHEYRLWEDKKSLEGSAVMFVTTFLIVFILLPIIDYLDGMTVSLATAGWIGLATGIFATVLEAISSGGSDNLTAPLGAAFVLSFMLSHSTQANVQFSIGLVLALVIAVISYILHFLTLSGSAGTFILAIFIFGIGGWIWAVPILTFFIFSSLLSRLGRVHKSRFGLMFEKSSQRDIGQVMANGGVPGLLVLIYNYFPDPTWYFLYLGALAAVNSDTWATEIGVFSKIVPRSIKNFQKVLPGTSGGITPLGTFTSLLGAFIIALSGLLVVPVSFRFSFLSIIFWVIVAAGFLAGFVDSFLGATVQAQYQCTLCKAVTERKKHCKGAKTELISGYRWLNNDWVNGMCSVSGALFVLVAVKIFTQF